MTAQITLTDGSRETTYNVVDINIIDRGLVLVHRTGMHFEYTHEEIKRIEVD